LVLSKCPRCGQSALDVGSRCPKCGFSLAEQRLRESGEASRRPAEGPGRGLTFTLAALVVLASAAALVITSRLERPSEPPVPSAKQGPAVAPDTSPPAVAAVPRAETVPAARPRVPDSVPAAPGLLTETRWTNDWSNVRAGPGIDDTVVLIVQPGMPVQVANRAAGWWEMFVNGRRTGYIAASLLETSPPDSALP
jgi:hypothetical protein